MRISVWNVAFFAEPEKTALQEEELNRCAVVIVDPPLFCPRQAVPPT